MLWGKGRCKAAQNEFTSDGRIWPRASAAAALIVLCSQLIVPASAKTPGARYCFFGLCHRVSTLSQTETFVGWRGYLLASFYDDCRHDRMNPCSLTSSGAVFRADLPDNAASPLFPDGTVILAYNPASGDASVLRITNAGPYSGERKLDVSRAGADALGFKAAGTAHLVVSVLKSPTVEEATYVKRRVYPSVPGHLGKYPNFDAAYAVAATKLELDPAPAANANAGVEASDGVSSAQDGLIVKPHRAVSPYFARELVMLRVPPRPVTRARQTADATADAPAEATDVASAPAPGAQIGFGAGLRKYMYASPVSGDQGP
jgi:rare lipoprotein A